MILTYSWRHNSFLHTQLPDNSLFLPELFFNTNYILKYFAIFTFFWFTNSHADSVLSDTLCWEENPGFLKGLFATKILGGICWVYNIQLFMSQQKLMFYGGFHESAEAYVLWWFSWVGRSLCSMAVFMSWQKLMFYGGFHESAEAYVLWWFFMQEPCWSIMAQQEKNCTHTSNFK